MNPCDNAVATTKPQIMTLQTEICFENVIIPILQGLNMLQAVMVARCQFAALH
jgi:hypothetical protein